MSVAEALGWARSLMDSLGLTNFIVAGVVVALASAALRRFFDR
jgi:hypothetical protein